MASLKDQITTDIDNLLYNTNEFSVESTYVPFGGSASTKKVSFFNDLSRVNSQNGDFEEILPWLSTPASQYTSDIKNKDTFTIGSITYRVNIAYKTGDERIWIVELIG